METYVKIPTEVKYIVNRKIDFFKKFTLGGGKKGDKELKKFNNSKAEKKPQKKNTDALPFNNIHYLLEKCSLVGGVSDFQP